jgi:hypothetical protein
MTDFVQDLEAELLAAARRRATGRRPLPRIAWRPLAIAVAAVALLAAVLALRPSGPSEPSTPKPSAFFAPPSAPIRACDGTPKEIPSLAVADIPRKHPPEQLTSELAVLRRPYQRADQLLVAAAPLEKWLPIGDFDDRAVRRASVPAAYVVPTGDLRTKPLDCGASTSRGPGVCLVMPTDFACFTLAEIREGRAFTRNGARLVGVVPDGVRWVRLSDMLGALAVDNVTDQLGTAAPLTVAFEREAPRVAVLNATALTGLAAGLADRLVPVLGRRPTAAVAALDSRSDIVYATRKEDRPLAEAIAHWIGAPSTGVTDDVTRLGAPENARIVVVLGSRMR